MNILHNINKYTEKYIGLRVHRSKKIPILIKVKKTIRWPNNASKEFSEFDLKTFLDETWQSFLSSVSDPDFLNTSKKTAPMYIDVNRKVKSIRFEQPNKDNFHLHSIKIYDKNKKPISVPSETVVRVSNRVNRYDKMTDDERRKRLFSSNGNHLYAFYTRNEGNSWVEITFPDVVFISKIKIKNTSKGINPRAHTSHKALGMRIFTTSKDGKLTHLYTLSGTRKFNIKYMKLAKYMNMNKYTHAKSVYDFVGAVIKMSDKKTCVKLFNKIPDKYRSYVSETLNDRILYGRNMEWTKHGIRKSFRFWDKSEKIDYINFSLDVIKDLKKLSSDVSFSSGSVLAAVRDKDLIPHDDDIDIMIALKPGQASTLTEAKKLVTKHMNNMGYKVTGDYFAHKKVINDRFQLDLFVGIYEGNKIGWYPHRRSAFDKSDIFPVKHIPVLNIDCPVPNNTIKYLEECYGENWRIPDPSWAIDWSQKDYEDMA